MSGAATIVVTWMDDRQETYQADAYRKDEDDLVLSETTERGRREVRHIPLHNVRVWLAGP